MWCQDLKHHFLSQEPRDHVCSFILESTSRRLPCFVLRNTPPPAQDSTSSPGKEMKVIDCYSQVTAGPFINPICLDPWSARSSDRHRARAARKHTSQGGVCACDLHVALPCQ